MIPKNPAAYEDEENSVLGSRRIYLLLLLYRVLGLSNTLILPQMALTNGAMGYIIVCLMCYICLGIPVTYMELLISQFTGRDCIDMWKIRPCLSHFGYFVQFWQLIIFIYNHSVVSILIHYFIISFESPPLYSQCGYWAKKSCNIIKFNYTANNRCIRSNDATQECDDLFHTYPEHQYYTYNLFEGRKREFFVAWTICVTSAVAIIFVYLNCFRRITSIKWFIYPMTLYPLLGYLLLLMGSMRQRGVILYYAVAMDMDFEDFFLRFQASGIILQTIYNVGAGTGILSNIGSLGTFRSPCFSNAVTAVLTSTVFTIVAIATSAMMACPYAYEYGGNTDLILDHPVSFTFVKMPRMLNEYYDRSLWLILTYSCQCVLGINNNVVTFYTFLETAAKRNDKIGKYSALFCLIVMISIFLFTIPTLGTVGKDIIGVFFRKCIFSVSLFVATLESIVFMMWYGYNKFHEDIHFMQGIQPKNYMKFIWMVLPIVLMYVFIDELINIITLPKTKQEYLGFSLMLFMITLPILIFFGKLLMAAFQKKFLHQFKLDPMWGPQDDVLRRSRAMFTAHAMTKEYMYRQYHLQAGIVARQQISNTRRNTQNTTSELRINAEKMA